MHITGNSSKTLHGKNAYDVNNSAADTGTKTVLHIYINFFGTQFARSAV